MFVSFLKATSFVYHAFIHYAVSPYGINSYAGVKRVIKLIEEC